MDTRAQCSVVTGVCPDTAGSFANDVLADSMSGDRQDGLTLVRFSRPAASSNMNDQMSGHAVDQAIKVQPGALTTVIQGRLLCFDFVFLFSSMQSARLSFSFSRIPALPALSLSVLLLFLAVVWL